MDKAHWWDNLSIRIIKICSKSLIFPLKLIFNSVLHKGVFSEEWKKSNVVPLHGKDSKNLNKNYRPISLTPTIVKVSERLV